MNEYLQSLSRALNRLDQAERDDILSDYREHFEIGLSQGKTEKQIAQELGEPESIAKLYTALSATTQAEKTKKPQDAMRMVGAAFAYRMGKGLIIGTLYLVFVLAIIPVFALGASLVVGAAALVCLAVLEFVKSFIAFGFLAVFAGITLLGMGALCLMGGRALWGKTIGALSSLARRRMDPKEERKTES
jgi:uncharacterized membrane protein